MSLSDFLDTLRASLGARQALTSIAKAFTTAEATDLSLLHFLLWLRPSGGLQAVTQEARWSIQEGAQEICRRLATKLGDSASRSQATGSWRRN